MKKFNIGFLFVLVICLAFCFAGFSGKDSVLSDETVSCEAGFGISSGDASASEGVVHEFRITSLGTNYSDSRYFLEYRLGGSAADDTGWDVTISPTGGFLFYDKLMPAIEEYRKTVLGDTDFSDECVIQFGEYTEGSGYSEVVFRSYSTINNDYSGLKEKILEEDFHRGFIFPFRNGKYTVKGNAKVVGSGAQIYGELMPNFCYVYGADVTLSDLNVEYEKFGYDYSSVYTYLYHRDDLPIERQPSYVDARNNSPFLFAVSGTESSLTIRDCEIIFSVYAYYSSGLTYPGAIFFVRNGATLDVDGVKIETKKYSNLFASRNHLPIEQFGIESKLTIKNVEHNSNGHAIYFGDFAKADVEIGGTINCYTSVDSTNNTIYAYTDTDVITFIDEGADELVFENLEKFRISNNYDVEPFKPIVKNAVAYGGILQIDFRYNYESQYYVAYVGDDLHFNVHGIRIEFMNLYHGEEPVWEFRGPVTAETTYKDILAGANPPAQAGKIFKGWVYNRYSSYSGGYFLGTEIIDENESLKTCRDHELTALWETDPNFIKLTFVGGEGSEGTAPAWLKGYDGYSIKLPDNTFMRADFTFAGWKAPDGRIYQANASYAVSGTSDIEFVATWTAISTGEPPKDPPLTRNEVIIVSVICSIVGVLAIIFLILGTRRRRVKKGAAAQNAKKKADAEKSKTDYMSDAADGDDYYGDHTGGNGGAGGNSAYLNNPQRPPYPGQGNPPTAQGQQSKPSKGKNDKKKK